MKIVAALLLILISGCSRDPYVFVRNDGPLVVLLAMDADNTLHGSMGRVVPDLEEAGFSLLTLDLPCHGRDADKDVSPLTCWRNRIERGDTEIFRRFCSELSASLDAIGASNVRVVGQSRGAYVAATCAAMDQRITALALLMPVTDLQRLAEFDGFRVDQLRFGLPAVRVPTYIRIGRADDRVGTDAAMEYGQRVSAKIDLVDVVGHKTEEDGSTVRWLMHVGS